MNSNQTNYRFYCEISYNKTIKRILQKPFVLGFTLLGMVNWFILFAIEKTNCILPKKDKVNMYKSLNHSWILMSIVFQFLYNIIRIFSKAKDVSFENDHALTIASGYNKNKWRFTWNQYILSCRPWKCTFEL